MSDATPNRPETKPSDRTRLDRDDVPRETPYTLQESGASGGPPPSPIELARGTDSAKDDIRPSERRERKPVDENNAGQHDVQGTADNDSDHEAGDKSEGVSKRMD